jgi:hypothetical protein
MRGYETVKTPLPTEDLEISISIGGAAKMACIKVHKVSCQLRVHGPLERDGAIFFSIFRSKRFHWRRAACTLHCTPACK